MNKIQDILGYSRRNLAARITELCAKGNPEQKQTLLYSLYLFYS